MRLLKNVYRQASQVSKNVISSYFNCQKHPDREFQKHDQAIVTLIEDMVGKTESVIALINNKKSSAIETITRMIFESYIYLKFILDKDTQKRGRAYIYSQTIKDIQFFRTITSDDKDGQVVRKYLGIDKGRIIKDMPELGSKELVEEVTKVYQDELGFKNWKREWYDFNGKTGNFRNLCEYMDKTDEYILIYKLLSREVHASQSRNYFKVNGDIASIYKKYVNVQMHINVVSKYLDESIKDIYSFYKMNDELKSYEFIMRYSITH